MMQDADNAWRVDVKRIIDNSLNAFFPNSCAFCGQVCQEKHDFPGICRSCLAGLPFRQNKYSRISWEDLGCFRPNDGSCVHCATWYGDPVRKALVRMKFGDSPELSQALTALLMQCWRGTGLDCTAVAAVPLHTSRQLERGYNQSVLLAERLAAQLDRPDWSSLLVRIRPTERQSGTTDRMARRINMAGAFKFDAAGRPEAILNQTGRQQTVLLVDDVLTTGTTLSEAAMPFFEAGMVVRGLVVSSNHRAADVA